MQQLSPNISAAVILAPPLHIARARIASTIAAVALAHVALIALVMRDTEKPVPPLALTSSVINAQLLSPNPPAAPAALESTPPPPKPVVKQKIEHPKPVHTPAPMRTRVPDAPAPPPAPAPSVEKPVEQHAEPAAPTQSSTQQAAPAAAPTQGRETLAISAPRNVHHLDCRIVKPEYPALSRRRGETGTAEVKFVIGLTGAIESTVLAKSSGYARLDDAAMAAMRASTCQPYLENGVAVRATYTQPFAFTFDE